VVVEQPEYREREHRPYRDRLGPLFRDQQEHNQWNQKEAQRERDRENVHPSHRREEAEPDGEQREVAVVEKVAREEVEAAEEDHREDHGEQADDDTRWLAGCRRQRVDLQMHRRVDARFYPAFGEVSNEPDMGHDVVTVVEGIAPNDRQQREREQGEQDQEDADA